MLKCHCFFCKRCFNEKVKAKLKKVLKKKDKSKVACSFCGNRQRIRIYSCSNSQEKKLILKFTGKHDPKSILEKCMEQQRIEIQNKKARLRNFEKKSIFLENLLKEVLNKSSVSVRKLKKRYSDKDDWGLLDKLGKKSKSCHEENPSKMQRKRERRKKRSKTRGVREATTRFKTKIMTKRNTIMDNNIQKSNLNSAFGGFKLKGLMSNVNQKSIVSSRRNSVNRSKLAQMICQMGEKKTFDLKY